MTHKTRDQHLFGPGPKRILALDGGGIRGILTLQVLRRIEEVVRQRTGRADACLADYFDLVGGTSTGAIIAAGVALGRTVDELDNLYRKLGATIFERRWHRWGLFRSKFPAKALRAALEAEFGGVRLGDDEIRSGLAIMTKRLDTGSPWIVHNNPRGKYFGPRAGGTATPNRDFLLRDIVRASTAAPHFFDPERIKVAADIDGAFVDGGVSPHNDPALQLVLLAALEGYAFGWSLGANNLLVVSVGTGSQELTLDADEVMEMPAGLLAVRSLSSLMDDAAALNQTLLQWLSSSPTARTIDREVGDLSGDLLTGVPLLTYLRYDAQLESGWLSEHLGLDLPEDSVESLRAMDDPQNLDQLATVGRAAAERLFDPAHLPAGFDID
jgi:hypothetical protein